MSGHLTLIGIALIAAISLNEAKGSFSIVLAHKPRLHVVVNKGGLARGRNCDKSYWRASSYLQSWTYRARGKSVLSQQTTKKQYNNDAQQRTTKEQQTKKTNKKTT